MTPITWILVAHRAGAILFAQSGKVQPLRLIETIEHPEGRLRNRDIDADTGGRSFDSLGGQRHTLTAHESPVDHVADGFVKVLAEKLRRGRIDGHCQHIVLVAGARLLGKLRDALDSPTAKLVTQNVIKDFGDLPEQEVIEALDKALAS
jgi:protein required for attachment to host cells